MTAIGNIYVALGGICIRKELCKYGSCQSCKIKSLCDVIHAEYNKELKANEKRQG